MNIQELNYYYCKFKYGEENFHELMQHRIENILLVSNFFDAYVLEQDGRLSEQIYGDYKQLHLSTAPQITTVPFTEDINSKLEADSYDLVIIMMRIGQISPFDLCDNIKNKFPDLPVILLLNKQSYVELAYRNKERMKSFDEVFLWNGDSMLFMAMIKLMEDKKNVEYDTKFGNVRVTLLIESAINYYSLFLPVFYTEAMKLTQELIQSELSDTNKRLRMRARPKVLMAHNYEDAIELYRKYKEYIICVISNVNLQVNNSFDELGGVKLLREIRQNNADLPILMQSADKYNKLHAKKLKAEFLNKNSSQLLQRIRRFIKNNLGFGDFVFRNMQEEEIGRAKNIYQFEQMLKEVPEESLLYHSDRNHFSAWLAAHGELKIAASIRHIVTADFLSIEHLREFLLQTISKVRQKQYQGKVIHYTPAILTEEDKIIQLTDGSMGGKGRGLAFLNSLLTTMDIDDEFDSISIKLPRTAIIGTNEFDIFLEQNKLTGKELIKHSDEEINKIFVKAQLSNELKSKLKAMLEKLDFPLAIRSSGLLEDSQSQPFAGIYNTYMLPNNNPDPNINLIQLCTAIKLVLASPFKKDARKYIESINYKLDEEKMAVVIQEIAGHRNDSQQFYPHLSGVAQSYNFYPSARMQHQDGIAALAVGLGKGIVDGERAFRYCPKHPKVDMLKPEGIVENNQRKFYALDLNQTDFDINKDEESFLQHLRISKKMKQEEFKFFTSVWDYQNSSFIDGDYAEGPRVLTFRQLVHFNKYPLSDIINRFLEIGELAMGVPIEIEFAVDFSGDEPRFYILQIRPLSINQETVQLKLDDINKDEALLITKRGMGNGSMDNIEDIVFVLPEAFDNKETIKMTLELEKINKKLKAENRHYILIGPGRWGSSDRFLGIPVHWANINMAKVIVEASLENFTVDASQGSHFFHNLVAMGVGYLTLRNKEDHLDWQWLKKQPVINQEKHIWHVRPPKNISVKIDGKSGKAVILK
jgi:CheY-like chemotaxis protein